MQPRGILVSPGPGTLQCHLDPLCASALFALQFQITRDAFQSVRARLGLYKAAPSKACRQVQQEGKQLAYERGACVAGRPEESGISLQIIQELGPELPVFGVCMGHQCIGQVFGGRVVRAPGGVMHGKTSLVYHSNTSLLKVCPLFIICSVLTSSAVFLSCGPLSGLLSSCLIEPCGNISSTVEMFV